MTETENTVSDGDNVNNTTQSVLATSTGESQQQETTTSAVVDNTPASNFADLLGPDGRFTDGWTNRLPEQLADHVKTLSKFKGPTELMTAYASLEKEFSKRTSLKVPGDDATPEQWDAYKKAVGADFKPEDYGLTPKEGTETAEWSLEAVNKATAVASKYGVPKQAMAELIGVYNEALGGLAKSAETAQAEQFQATMDGLKKEWGVNLNNNLQRAQRAAAAIGIDANDPQIGNNATIIKALMKVDELIGEDRTALPGVAPTNTYEEMYNKILKSDDYMGKNGMTKQLEAADKLKNIFEAMRK